jgi:uncharacterized phage protein (TIGR01671 family)
MYGGYIMQREIKFRVWTGIKMEYNVVVGKLGAFYVEGLDPKDSACLSPFNTIYQPDTPVMQYTGLKDKNRKEIYEGDVVSINKDKISGKNGRVVFNNGAFIVITEVGKWSLFYYDPKDVQLEVIGNIYENPELINSINH